MRTRIISRWTFLMRREGVEGCIIHVCIYKHAHTRDASHVSACRYTQTSVCIQTSMYIQITQSGLYHEKLGLSNRTVKFGQIYAIDRIRAVWQHYHVTMWSYCGQIYATDRIRAMWQHSRLTIMLLRDQIVVKLWSNLGMKRTVPDVKIMESHKYVWWCA
jgi:hypothetical protein